VVDLYDEELFLAYTEGELSHEKRAAFENQMLQDPRLRNLVAQLVLDRHRLRTLPDEAPPEHLMDIVHERLERSMLLGATPQEFTASSRKTSRSFRWRRVATLGGMAAMFALVAGVFVVTLLQLASDTPIQSAGPAGLLPSILRPGGLPANLPPSAEALHKNAAAVPPVEPKVPPQIAMGQPLATTAHLPGQDSAEQSPDVKNSHTNPFMNSTEVNPAQRVPHDILHAVLPPPVERFIVTTSDLPEAHRRLLAWMTAYQVKLLDTRLDAPGDAAAAAMPSDAAAASQPAVTGPLAWLQLTDTDDPALVSPPTTPGANQALSLVPPAAVASTQPASDTSLSHEQADPKARTAGTTQPAKTTAASRSMTLTLFLPGSMRTPLASFLETLPAAVVTRIATPAGQAEDRVEPGPPGSSIKHQDVMAAPRIHSTLSADFAQALVDAPNKYASAEALSPLQSILGNPSDLPAWLLADPLTTGRSSQALPPLRRTASDENRTEMSEVIQALAKQQATQAAKPVVVTVELQQTLRAD
jgi:hypothetical protein